MRVTDTQALIYHAFGPKSSLGAEAKRVFSKAEAGQTIVVVPTVVLWEVAHQIEQGRIRLHLGFERWCRHLMDHTGFDVVSLDWLDVNSGRKLPFKDPFDRLIVGTALRLEMPLITRDQNIVDSGLVETIW